MSTDQIADMFTSLRNANLRCRRTVIFPFSRFKLDICQKMKDTNFLTQHWVDDKARTIKVEIKYFNRNSCLHEIKRISTPSKRIFLKVQQIQKKLRGKETYLISTPYGLLTHREAIAKNVGGEVIGLIS